MKTILPGFLAALIIAFIAKLIETILPVHLIGASIIALFIGMFFHNYLFRWDIFKNGVSFTSKKILRLAIILLGASLNITVIFQVGKLSMTVMAFTLLACFGGGYVIGKILGIDWKLSSLISAGTGICGGSAIAAIAPVIHAKDRDIAYAMSATFLFDMAMIVLFPFWGKALGLSDMAYGLWAGTAVNDTSSVVAAGYAYSENAGDFAMMVKLTRTLAIIPTVLVFAMISLYKKSGISDKTAHPVRFRTLLPWFILGFLLLSILYSIGLIPETISGFLKELSKFLMITALAAIGLNTSFHEMRKSGFAPMMHGFLISALVVIVALGVEYMMGII